MSESRASRWLLWCGVVGPILFVAVFLVEGAIRQDYDPARTFVSQLSLGDQGWLQIANFVVSGSLIVLFAFGLRAVTRIWPAARWGPIMVGLVGLGLIVAGVFVADPALGYPPGTPPGLTMQPSWQGMAHLLGAVLVFGGLPIACFIFARRFRALDDEVWATYSLATGIGMLGFFVAANIGANGVGGLDGVAGWLQRVAVAVGFAWLTLLALRYARRPATIAELVETQVSA